MATDEKKYSLDELPDQGSEPEVKPTPAPKFEKPEPRIQQIKKLSKADQVEALGKRWYFDMPKRQWGWLVFLIVMIALEQSHILDQNSAGRKAMAENSFGASEIAFIGVDIFDFLLRHPLVFAILIPFIFKFTIPSEYFFEITFGGISTVKEVRVGSIMAPTRVNVPWDEIKNVTKGKVKGREILILHNANGPMAQMIWDIDKIKKKVINQVVKGLVSSKHPFREFIEKDVA